MNIFFLSMSIKRCAQFHFDKHVIKMILEYCQLLSTAWHIIDPIKAPTLNIYRKTHINHPCAIWCRLHLNNYLYVARLGLELCKEWRFRYNHTKIHACEEKLLFLYYNPPILPNFLINKTLNNPKSLQLPLPQAMPNECKINKNTVHSAVKAYRNYYKSSYKYHLRNWKNRNNPYWW